MKSSREWYDIYYKSSVNMSQLYEFLVGWTVVTQHTSPDSPSVKGSKIMQTDSMVDSEVESQVHLSVSLLPGLPHAAL